MKKNSFHLKEIAVNSFSLGLSFLILKYMFLPLDSSLISPKTFNRIEEPFLDLIIITGALILNLILGKIFPNQKVIENFHWSATMASVLLVMLFAKAYPFSLLF